MHRMFFPPRCQVSILDTPSALQTNAARMWTIVNIFLPTSFLGYTWHPFEELLGVFSHKFPWVSTNRQNNILKDNKLLEGLANGLISTKDNVMFLCKFVLRFLIGDSISRDHKYEKPTGSPISWKFKNKRNTWFVLLLVCLYSSSVISGWVWVILSNFSMSPCKKRSKSPGPTQKSHSMNKDTQVARQIQYFFYFQSSNWLGCLWRSQAVDDTGT